MTLDEIFSTEFFKNTVREEIDVTHNERVQTKNRIIEKQSHTQRILSPIRFRSNAFSTLYNMGGLHPDFLSKEYLLIYEQRSKLAAREREWIKGFIGNAILKTINHYSKLEKETASVKISKNR